MASSFSLPQGLKQTWLHRWIYYLAAGFMFAAAALRALIIFQDDPYLGLILLLIAACVILFSADNFISRKQPGMMAVFLAAQAGLILLLLVATRQDFFAFLFAVLGMQAMQRYSPRSVAALIGLFAVATFLTLYGVIGPLQALALTVIYAALGSLLAGYVWYTRSAELVQAQQQDLVRELQEANQQLEYQASQQEQIAAGHERQRLARELHDSVTQTIFSMTLTTQSALLLLKRDRGKVAEQLDRLDQLAQSALAEMQQLISRLAPQAVTGDGFVNALQRHLDERHQLESLDVILEVEGDRPLDPAEEAGLFRIAQEALNNIVKHARVTQATLRLHLAEPFWMEVEDRGAGFDPRREIGRGRLGLAGMGERAAEIGWTLRVESSPGSGTCIRVEKEPEGENHS